MAKYLDPHAGGIFNEEPVEVADGSKRWLVEGMGDDLGEEPELIIVRASTAEEAIQAVLTSDKVYHNYVGDVVEIDEAYSNDRAIII